MVWAFPFFWHLEAVHFSSALQTLSFTIPTDRHEASQKFFNFTPITRFLVRELSHATALGMGCRLGNHYSAVGNDDHVRLEP